MLAAWATGAVAETGAPATPAGAGSDTMAALAGELFKLLVVATVMESALTTLFNWRLYQEFFNGRAIKTLVMVAFGYAVVTAFGFDIFHTVLRLAGSAAPASGLSQLLSALILAGGSAAVYELFQRLGLRAPIPAPEPGPQPADDKAWVSVRIVPRRAVGSLKVHIDKVALPSDDQLARPALAGCVARPTFAERLQRVFFANPMRLPAYGGRTIDTTGVYRIAVSGRRAITVGSRQTEDFQEEVYVGRFAGRAIVDLVYEV